MRGSAMTSERAGGTRERILVLLRRHGRLSAPRLAELLQLTSVGVRRHLALLERDGLVGATIEKPKRGRPTAVYRLTDAGLETFPRHYDEVAPGALGGGGRPPRGGGGPPPPPLRRGRPGGAGLPQGPGRGHPGPVPGLAQR